MRLGNAAELYVEQAIAWYGVTLKESPFEIGRGGTLRLKTRSLNPIERHEEAIFERASKTGIAGHWIVNSTDKNGKFSDAQIGQEPGDIISIQKKELRVQVT